MSAAFELEPRKRQVSTASWSAFGGLRVVGNDKREVESSLPTSDDLVQDDASSARRTHGTYPLPDFDRSGPPFDRERWATEVRAIRRRILGPEHEDFDPLRPFAGIPAHDPDPHGPAIDPEAWEALRDNEVDES